MSTYSIPAVPYPPFARLSGQCDRSQLQNEVDQLSSLDWLAHVNQRDYNGVWDVLALRCQAQHLNAHPILQGFATVGDVEWNDLPILQRCPAIQNLLMGLNCALKAVRLMRLQAGAEILPHRDRGLAAEFGEARLHVPVYSPAGVGFFVDGARVPMLEGELWYINADREHWVTNRSTEHRIHLVIDCVVNEGLLHQIHSASVACQPSNHDGS